MFHGGLRIHFTHSTICDIFGHVFRKRCACPQLFQPHTNIYKTTLMQHPLCGLRVGACLGGAQACVCVLMCSLLVNCGLNLDIGAKEALEASPSKGWGSADLIADH